MKPTWKGMLLAALMFSQDHAFARDYEQDRANYYNSQRTLNGERTVAAPRVDVDEHSVRNKEARRKNSPDRNRDVVSGTLVDGSDNDVNNRGRHSAIFPKGASRVVKH